MIQILTLVAALFCVAVCLELMRRLNFMTQALEKIRAEVEESRSITEGAVALLAELANKIRDAGVDEAALNQLADDIDGQSDALAAAVLANTPQPDQPTPEPAPETAPEPAPTPEPEPAPEPAPPADEEPTT